MIQIDNKNECCGCGVCANKCPHQCVHMTADEEGFLYPVIDFLKCVNCGQCEQVCPVINHDTEMKMVNRAYAAKNKDWVIRKRSSSGGIFYLLAKHCIVNGGVVAGAAFGRDFVLRHQIATNLDELSELLRSKYIESKTGNIFREVKSYLDRNIPVLFSGTPCQVEALLNFVGKPYANLTTIDIICYGVPSPLLWEKYKLWLKDKNNGAEIQEYFFRDKESGWRHWSVMAKFNDSSVYTQTLDKDPMVKAFLKNLCLRPSCYSCEFKGADRKSDITLGDFWGIEFIAPEFDDDKGVSVVITHGAKGASLFCEIQNSIEFFEVDIFQALKFNLAALKTVAPARLRKDYMKDLNHVSCEVLDEKYCKENFIVAMIKNIVKHI